jgi:hypothetical protein
MSDSEPMVKTLGETENYMAWKAEEPDGESIYHLDLIIVTFIFFTEEWNDLLIL